jgi:hypothetical protein
MAAASEPIPDRFAAITRLFDSVAIAFDLNILRRAADKHGFIEWSATRKDDITRYLTLDLIPQGDGVAVYECWAGADDDVRYTRRLVERSLAFPIGHQPASLLDRMQRSLQLGWSRAESLADHDLDQAYLSGGTPA